MGRRRRRPCLVTAGRPAAAPVAGFVGIVLGEVGIGLGEARRCGLVQLREAEVEGRDLGQGKVAGVEGASGDAETAGEGVCAERLTLSGL